jgi:hypothetical protein
MVMLLGMTKLLEQAFAEAAKLPAEAQDALAAAILQEVASEEHWTAAFARHSDALAALADEALRELHAGKTQSLDPEQL